MTTQSMLKSFYFGYFLYYSGSKDGLSTKALPPQTNFLPFKLNHTLPFYIIGLIQQELQITKMSTLTNKDIEKHKELEHYAYQFNFLEPKPITYNTKAKT